jgi:hypothetical protein
MIRNKFQGSEKDEPPTDGLSPVSDQNLPQPPDRMSSARRLTASKSFSGGWPRRFRSFTVSGAPSFPGLVHGKGGVLRPRIRSRLPVFPTLSSRTRVFLTPSSRTRFRGEGSALAFPAVRAVGVSPISNLKSEIQNPRRRCTRRGNGSFPKIRMR